MFRAPASRNALYAAHVEPLFRQLPAELDSYIRRVQELLGHADVIPAMIYKHVLKLGGGVVRRPLDALTESDLLQSRRR